MYARRIARLSNCADFTQNDGERCDPSPVSFQNGQTSSERVDELVNDIHGSPNIQMNAEGVDHDLKYFG